MRKFVWVVSALVTLVAVLCPTLVRVPGALYVLYRADPRWPQFYDALAILMRVFLPHSDVTCLNYGWSLPTEHPRFSTMREGTCLQLYELAVQSASQRTLAENDLGQRDGAFAGLDIVEIGSGRGGGARYVSGHHKPRTLIGVDASKENVRQSIDLPNLGVARFVVGDAQRLPLRSASADVVLNIESMHAYPDLNAFFRETRRILRAGGVLVVADVLYPRPDGDAKSLAAALPWSGDATSPRLRLVSEHHLNAGVVRAVDRNTLWPSLLAEVPPWLYRLIPGLNRTLQSFTCGPNGKKRRALSSGRLRYRLAIFEATTA